MLDSLPYRSKIEDAHGFLQAGHFEACIRACGSLLESAFRQLYEKLMLHFSVPQRIEIMHIEEDITQGKGVTKAGLGQLYGIFEKAELFKVLARHNGQGTNSIAKLDFSNLIHLRNQVTHHGHVPDVAETSLCFFTVYRFLKLTVLKDWNLPESQNTLPPHAQQLSPLESYQYLLEIVWQKGYASPEESAYLRQKAHAFDLRYQEVEQLEHRVKQQFQAIPKTPEPQVTQTPSVYAVPEVSESALPSERYQRFFQSVLDGLKTQAQWTQAEKAQPKSALNLSVGLRGFQVGVSFAHKHRFRAELYIDTGERTANKKAFDWLQQHRASLEKALGDLTWERLDSRRASRIAWYTAGDIQDDAEQLADLRHIAIERLLAFYAHFKPLLHTYQQQPVEESAVDTEALQRWQARTGPQVIQRVQRLVDNWQQHVGPLQLDLSHHHCFKLKVEDQDWLHLWPRKNGFTLYLPDAASEDQLPSEDYADLFDTCEALDIAVRWQTEYDQGKHPIHCVITDTHAQNPSFLKLLKHNYDTFCRNQSG